MPCQQRRSNVCVVCHQLVRHGGTFIGGTGSEPDTLLHDGPCEAIYAHATLDQTRSTRGRLRPRPEREALSHGRFCPVHRAAVVAAPA